MLSPATLLNSFGRLSFPRLALYAFMTGFVLSLWQLAGPNVGHMRKLYGNTPMQTDSVELRASTVDLNPVAATRDAVANREKVLIVTPLRDAAWYLPKYFELLAALTYPHELIDVAFLVSDTADDTLGVLDAEIAKLQGSGRPLRSALIVRKDFGVDASQDVESRHSFEFQGPRRKALGKARNFLLNVAMRPDHSWVYWRDVDIVENPDSVLEDLMAHDKDIIVPNVWFHRGDTEGRFDYNSWQESEQGLALAASLPKDTVLAEGYKEYSTNRAYLAWMAAADWRDHPEVEVDLDGIGGVSILVKADVHRAGINFPSYAFENQAETEGFGKMAKRAGYQVVGLPNYVVWHIDTEEKPGNSA